MKRVIDPFSHPLIKVPAFKPWITNEDKKAVLKSLNSGMLTLGPKLEEFESMFAKYVGSKFAMGVSNGTSALHLSLESLDIGRGDEVIIPDFTFIADINAVIHTGATPVLADIEENQFGISLKSIKNKITEKTKAIIPVHMYGEACKMDEIMDIARSNKLLVVEDCAHAIGTNYKNKHVGTFGSVGCFSFYPTKNITSVEGGMIITNSRKISDRIKRLRNHGMTRTLSQRYSTGYPWLFDVKEPGYNYRLDELRCSLGISQLKRINEMNEMRRRAVIFYNEGLKNVKGIILPKIVNDKSHSYHLYHIRIKKEYGLTRDQLFKDLLRKGIRTTLYYVPLHKFSAYKKFVRNPKEFSNSSNTYKEILSLPLFPTISEKEQRYVIQCIIDNKKRKQ